MINYKRIFLLKNYFFINTEAVLPPLNIPQITDMPATNPVGRGAIEVTPILILVRLFIFWEPRHNTNKNKMAVEKTVARIRSLISMLIR